MLMNTVKKFMLILALGFYPLLSIGQASEEKSEDIQQLETDPKGKEKVKAIHIAVITNKLGLTPEQAEKFWPIYNEFTEKRKLIRQEFKGEQAKMGKTELSEEQKQKLVELGYQKKQQEVDLEKNYSGRLLKVISTDQMLKLPTAERDFQRMLIQQLQQRKALQQRRENLRDRNQLQRQKRN